MDQPPSDHRPFSTRRPVTGAAFSCPSIPTPLFNDAQVAADQFIDNRIGGAQPTVAQIREAFLRGALLGLRYAESHGLSENPPDCP